MVFSILVYVLQFALWGFPSVSLALTPAEQKVEWEAELSQTEADITKWQSILDHSKAGTASLQHDASVLNAKIQQAKLFIKRKNIAIAQLASDIADKNTHITQLENRIRTGHDSLAQLLRKTNEIDQYSLPEVVLGEQNLSDFFGDIESFQSVNKSLSSLFVKIRETKDLTVKEKVALDAQKTKEADTRAAAVVQQQQVQANEKQKEYLIQVNKTQEKTYSQVLSDQKAKAAKIRAALFALAGGSAAIPFGDAFKFAQEASVKTGVRPAFLLAILTQESNLGSNVGTCNKPGGPSSKDWHHIMPGPDQISAGLSRRDDQSAFVRITSALGLNPDIQRLSCPMGGGGWGGAMGPSQFIPTTWENYQSKIARAVGKSVVNPWNAEDAFMASAIYLSELGAGGGNGGGGGYTAEHTAALKYYAGGNWNKRSNAFYGDQVLAKATSIQTTMIDPLNL